jgi:hypothetical protein
LQAKKQEIGHFEKSTEMNSDIEKSSQAVTKLTKILFNACCSLASLRYAFVENFWRIYSSNLALRKEKCR